MRIKLLMILFVGCLTTFIDEINSENICRYSDPSSFIKCKSDNSLNIIPKYPISTHLPNFKTFNYAPMWIGGLPYLNHSPGMTYKIIEISSETGKSLDIKTGNKTAGLMGISRRMPLKNEKSFSIPGENVLSWEYEYIEGTNVGYRRTAKFKFKYLNENGDEDSIDINRLVWGDFSNPENEMLDDIFIDITKLQKGQKRTATESLLKQLKEAEKRYEIIKSIIFIDEDKSNKCLNLNDAKFPALSEEFKKVSKKINPIRKKLDLPISEDFKSICGEVPGRRPLWMEEKIKGCNKYPTKKQRDYCINIYSPYGKE